MSWRGLLYGPGDFQYQPGCRLCDALRNAMQVAEAVVPREQQAVPAPAIPQGCQAWLRS